MTLAATAATSDRATVVATLARPRTAELLGGTLTLVVVVVLLALLVGTSLAWLVEATDLPGRRVIAVLAPLPLAIPSYVAATAWMSHSPWLQGFAGAVLVLTCSTYPYVYLLACAAIRSLDPAHEDASRSLGASRSRTFVRVTLPRLRPALASGGLLVATYALSDFGSVSIVRFDAITRVVYASLNGFDRSTAMTLASLLGVVALLIVVGEQLSRGHGSSRDARATPRAVRRPTRLGRAAPVAWIAAAAVVVIAVGVPVATIVGWSIAGRSAPDALGQVVAAAADSASFAALGAVVTIVVALPIGLYAAAGTRLGRALEVVAYVAHGIPSIAIALALVVITLRVTPALYQSAAGVAAAYAVLFLPIAVGGIRSAALRVPAGVVDVGRTLGRGRLATFATITVPLLAPGIAAVAALVLLTGMKELTATLLLYPTGHDTLAIRVWSEATTRSYAAAAPYALTLLLVAALPAHLLARQLARSGKTGAS